MLRRAEGQKIQGPIMRVGKGGDRAGPGQGERAPAPL